DGISARAAGRRHRQLGLAPPVVAPLRPGRRRSSGAGAGRRAAVAEPLAEHRAAVEVLGALGPRLEARGRRRPADALTNLGGRIDEVGPAALALDGAVVVTVADRQTAPSLVGIAEPHREALL